MKACSTALALCLCFCQSVLAAGTVKLDKQGDTINVTIDGQEFTTYHFGKDLPKPFFEPVRSADGDIITRPLEKPKDHPHHKGIWVSVDEVNEIRFWAEKGKIQTQSLDILTPEGNPAKFKVVNHWLGKDGQPVLTETTVISVFANRLFGYDITFTAGSNPVEFKDTKEGLLGFRFIDPLREVEGSKITNADGLKTTKECWGKTSDWVDYSGKLNGKEVGVALFDHPDNPTKSRYHVRDYGLFSISPFGSHAYTNGKEPANELHLKPGESYRLRYGLYVHPGDVSSGKVAETHAEYVSSAKK